MKVKDGYLRGRGVKQGGRMWIGELGNEGWRGELPSARRGGVDVGTLEGPALSYNGGVEDAMQLSSLVSRAV